MLRYSSVLGVEESHQFIPNLVVKVYYAAVRWLLYEGKDVIAQAKIFQARHWHRYFICFTGFLPILVPRRSLLPPHFFLSPKWRVMSSLIRLKRFLEKELNADLFDYLIAIDDSESQEKEQVNGGSLGEIKKDTAKSVTKVAVREA
ncbi:hypothetical protein K2173_002532 [Erythroxylum novogranatense]|uniref:Uncharacterized protein n=1 Tax=Erythroxylum novogranatense TaxID=1862640 RepID=A0AAV8TT09_9ROSI|nr:hypothetical protein K2173_002532 [Erythroxylum novogranatense]